MVQNSAEKWRPEHQKCVLDAIAAFDEGSFFAAHERLEDGMRVSQGELRTLFHALAQVAASHHLLTLGRGRAAVRTWQKARTKLAHIGQLSADFAEAMQTFHARLAIDAEGPRFIEPVSPGPAQVFPTDPRWRQMARL